VNFVAYIEESISYNFLYLILACIKIFVLKLKFSSDIDTIDTSNHQFHYTVVNDIISYITLFAQ